MSLHKHYVVGNANSVSSFLENAVTEVYYFSLNNKRTDINSSNERSSKMDFLVSLTDS